MEENITIYIYISITTVYNNNIYYNVKYLLHTFHVHDM